MPQSFTAVTCPECRTGQEIPSATPTRCICCGAEIDAMPGKYMRVIPNHAGQHVEDEVSRHSR
ncbi:hypothetical protein C882_4511 [Caenispirillum salinarum AK4]|uniref:Uncharacterized protein n=1 Tax=Caenispirillum salinarum AK4 TaxID=1238182 RepID=K9GZ26_9PROT|nr:hypothetical protein [Caenispirillum salinarum]EKV30552.1 hypothetical protein C882_4511 [Caenispirillum salinarum AK4]